MCFWSEDGRGNGREPIFEVVSGVLVFGEVAAEVRDVDVLRRVGGILTVDAIEGGLEESWLWWHGDGPLAQAATSVLSFPFVEEHLLGGAARIGFALGIVAQTGRVAGIRTLFDAHSHTKDLLLEWFRRRDEARPGVYTQRRRLALQGHSRDGFAQNRRAFVVVQLDDAAEIWWAAQVAIARGPTFGANGSLSKFHASLML